MTTRASVHEARGDLEHLLGEFEKAILEYQASIEVSAAADDLDQSAAASQTGQHSIPPWQV